MNYIVNLLLILDFSISEQSISYSNNYLARATNYYEIYASDTHISVLHKQLTLLFQLH